ncbi:hypothetical protein [Legionella gresilensis]|uniref:hypothetical protein n=1 Tax=Legionella gresilensis TaxID=91823 RepID=UPI0010419831|nr:hypothetical protein [Legionella gresilensis]
MTSDAIRQVTGQAQAGLKNNDPYMTIGVKPDATRQEIWEAYLETERTINLDESVSTKDKEQLLKQLDEIYDKYLKNDDVRNAYDNQRKSTEEQIRQEAEREVDSIMQDLLKENQSSGVTLMPQNTSSYTSNPLGSAAAGFNSVPDSSQGTSNSFTDDSDLESIFNNIPKAP